MHYYYDSGIFLKYLNERHKRMGLIGLPFSQLTLYLNDDDCNNEVRLGTFMVQSVLYVGREKLRLTESENHGSFSSPFRLFLIH